MSERCKRCGLPIADDEAAWQLVSAMNRQHAKWPTIKSAIAEKFPGMHTEFTCRQVDWYARALAAEDRLSRLVAEVRTLVTEFRPTPGERAAGIDASTVDLFLRELDRAADRFGPGGKERP